MEREIAVNAPVEEVWKALTDPAELARWFPLEARITPGKEGSIFLSWGPDCAGEAKIVGWEPGKRFAWQEAQALVEWTLESRGGKTLVRLVQTGFAGESDWENEWLASTSYGWGFMLLSLQVALERHRGAQRQVAWPRLRVNCTREEAYRRLMAAGGLFVENAEDELRQGEVFTLRAVHGDIWTGSVEFVQPPRGFCVTIRELNDALLWLTIEGVPGKHEVQLWLSAFGLPQMEVDAFGVQWMDGLKKLFSH